MKILLTYLLTPWSRVLLEKLTGLQLVKFPTFYWTRRFITAVTNARHLSLSWASSIQSIRPHPTSWRSILILSSHLLHEDPYTFMVISHWILLRVRNVTDKISAQNRNTHFYVQWFFPPKIVGGKKWASVKKYSRAYQATDENIIRHFPFACWIS